MEELKTIRLKKLKAIEAAGFLAYPAKTKRTHCCEKALADFPALSRSKKEIVLINL